MFLILTSKHYFGVVHICFTLLEKEKGRVLIEPFSQNLVPLINLVPKAIMWFSCTTQPPVMTLVPTYTFAGNLFLAFVMYA